MTGTPLLRACLTASTESSIQRTRLLMEPLLAVSVTMTGRGAYLSAYISVSRASVSDQQGVIFTRIPPRGERLTTLRENIGYILYPITSGRTAFSWNQSSESAPVPCLASHGISV